MGEFNAHEDSFVNPAEPVLSAAEREMKLGPDHTGDVLADTELVSGEELSVVSREALLPNGKRVTASVVRHPGAAAIVAMLDDHRVLLIRQYRVAILDWIWEIPAGTLRPGEAPSDCARREFREETGYEAARLERIGELLPVPDYSDDLVHLFLATDLTVVDQQLADDEVIEVSWIALDEAMGMVYSGRIRDAKTIVGLFVISNRFATK